MESYKRLGWAVLKRAVVDAAKGDHDAKRWLLFSELAALLFDVLDVDAGRVRRTVLAM